MNQLSIRNDPSSLRREQTQIGCGSSSSWLGSRLVRVLFCHSIHVHECDWWVRLRRLALHDFSLFLLYFVSLFLLYFFIFVLIWLLLFLFCPKPVYIAIWLILQYTSKALNASQSPLANHGFPKRGKSSANSEVKDFIIHWKIDWYLLTCN